ncbi:Gfo/Idh/MocA family oxidoreductase [Conexibacter sp. JD483]|uniref:Gfo/Idh/MocA family protein n=1 Tax=unclassified Conexibacter TaxID=2627773 RepID=UPI002726077A|nr:MULTISPECIES: Gfo/Idh/MocA family oxidoreductase [unclassified Conexibacter]MDO8184409.1 Gfo/Idh/MocA family oxidoreductase [Conexibacter sp. CPCC 205706]MDO8197715.1 Gfo/Idh/MocA family oxidoreductase [Conexibacter sp. CPCC 205762]MDR9368149.1 Gfo/Idh/MocA family oxidoreductase [Conexibacter sp. JD483]
MTPNSPAPLRAAVLGLGMMGRHHARLLQTLPGVEFAGAVDPAGDRHGVVRDPALVFATLEQLLDSGRLDMAVVALPTEEHLPAALALTSADVAMLIEKPLAATTEDAELIIAAVRHRGLAAAVGHVERFNPSLVALRRRLEAGQLGDVFLVATERVGPFPERIKDVGVIKDLATHDLDIVSWIAGSPITTVAAQTAHRTGRPHEDLVLVNGRVASDVPFNTMVDWLSPTKTRRTRVLGDRGMLVAETVTADLTFYENGQVTSDWSSSQALRGVTEGDATRYALARSEPIRSELEAFRDLVAGDPDAPVVTLAQGFAAVRAAEAVLESAQSGRTVQVAP